MFHITETFKKDSLNLTELVCEFIILLHKNSLIAEKGYFYFQWIFLLV